METPVEALSTHGAETASEPLRGQMTSRQIGAGSDGMAITTMSTTMGTSSRSSAWAYGALLTAVLATGLYMRVANLGDVQHFESDQGRDYVEVMKWLKDGGPWPLLGQDRSVGDKALGPGWFYTVAPAMVLSGYHPAAGAATIAVMAVLTIFLCADWVRRATASRAAALVTAGVVAFSAPWTSMGRTLWNPNALPLAVAALTWLIALMPRRPVPCLATALALVAVLPQWHTVGLLVDVAALGPLALAWRAAGPAARATPRRTWVLWGGSLAVAIALLYVPPLIHELKPGTGNMASFFVGSDVLAQPRAGALPQSGVLAFDKLVRWGAHQSFLTAREFVSTNAMILRLLLGGGVAAAFALLYGSALRRRAAEPAAGFLALLVVVFWSILVLKGAAVRDYYFIPAYLAMLLLGGWTAGSLLGHPQPTGDDTRPIGRMRVARALGMAMLLSTVGLSVAQLPRAWAIHDGVGRYGRKLRATRETAEFIARDAHGRSFSVELADWNSSPAHFHYLLRRLGRSPLNSDYSGHRIRRRDMGERIYVVVSAPMARVPRLEGLPGPPLGPSLETDYYSVYRFETAALPPETRALKLAIDPSVWTIRAER